MKYHWHANLLLDAITLRGVGSYLRGARLEIKPLTILCGKNGSGKSTWLKSLNILEQSLETRRFPFGFGDADWNPHDIQLTNAYCHLAGLSDLQAQENDAEENRFGSLGTIGIEFHAENDFSLAWHSDEIVEHDLTEEARRLFFKGSVKAGDHFRVRVAHPTYHSDHAPTPMLRHVIEIQFNGVYTLRLEGERDPFQKFEREHECPRRSKPYTLLCSRAVLAHEIDDDSNFIPIGLIHDLNQYAWEPLFHHLDASQVAAIFIVLRTHIVKLTREVLRGLVKITCLIL